MIRLFAGKGLASNSTKGASLDGDALAMLVLLLEEVLTVVVVVEVVVEDWRRVFDFDNKFAYLSSLGFNLWLRFRCMSMRSPRHTQLFPPGETWWHTLSSLGVGS